MAKRPADAGAASPRDEEPSDTPWLDMFKAQGKPGCPFCESERHHDRIMPPAKEDQVSLAEPTVSDAIWHSIVAAGQVLMQYGVPKERYMDVLGPVASAMGWIAHAAERSGRDHAIEKFWLNLIAEQGPGTFVFDVGPRGIEKVRPS